MSSPRFKLGEDCGFIANTRGHIDDRSILKVDVLFPNGKYQTIEVQRRIKMGPNKYKLNPLHSGIVNYFREQNIKIPTIARKPLGLFAKPSEEQQEKFLWAKKLMLMDKLQIKNRKSALDAIEMIRSRNEEQLFERFNKIHQEEIKK
jgi:hypothetical protein